MEHRIGDIVTLPDGRKVEVVEASHHECDGCLFNGEYGMYFDCLDVDVLPCADIHRTDHKDIIYKEIKVD